MLSLLKSNDKRKIELLETLIESRTWITYSDLAKKLSSSVRILQDDVSYIREHYPSITITTSNKGIRLESTHSEGIKDTFRNIIHSNLSFQVLELLFFNETLSISELATHFYTSTSTMYRVIDAINDYFKAHYGCYIQTNPCKFVGNEKNVRTYYKTYFSEAYTILDWPFKDHDENEINDKFDKILSFIKVDFEMDFAFYESIKLNVMVNLYRYEHNHLIDTTEDESSLLNLILGIAKLFFKATAKEVSREFDAEYVYQVFSPYIKHGGSFNQKQLENLRKKNSTIDEALTFLASGIESISDYLDIHVNTEELILAIYGTTFLEEDDPNVSYILYNQNKYFTNIIKQLLPELYAQIYSTIVTFRQKLHLDLTEKKINYLIFILFTNWKDLLGQLYNQVRQVSIIIISDRHVSHADMIKSALLIAIRSNIKIDIYSQKQITKEILEKLPHDIIISTFTLPPSIDKEIIIIEHFPTLRDIASIESSMNKIYSTIIGEAY